MNLTSYLPFKLSLRPVTPADNAFLLNLFTSTRPMFSQMGLPDSVTAHLLEQQFQLQQQAYQQQAPDAHMDIILVEEQLAGRLTVNVSPHEIRLMELTLMPQWQKKGYGTQLLGALQQLATQQQKRLALSVDIDNKSAISLYLKQGFVIEQQQGFYLQLYWLPVKI